jgi:hypothetical protein
MRMTAIAIGELVLALLAAPAFAQSGASGSQYQVETFTGTNAASGNANLLTDAYNDFLVPSGHLEISTGAYGFSLGIRDPNGDLTLAVPTFRATTSNAITALDVLPNGTATDNGWGAAWADICNSDITNDNFNANTSCVHLGARSNGEVDIGENSYGNARVGPVVIVDGPGGGSSATKVATFSSRTGVGIGTIIGFETIYSAAGTAIPAAASGNAHYRACVSDSTGCTSGTTYTSGGADACEVWSDGTDWIESGSGC